MEQHAVTIKALFAGVFAFFSALWGTLGWLVVIWIGCMALDYLSGSLAARRKGKWSSAAAREGLAGKGGMILFVFGAAALDLLLGLALNNLPEIALPFDYTMPICGLVLCWYIITEVGSLFENAERLGASWPPFLKKVLGAMREYLMGKTEQHKEAEKRDGPENEE